MGIINVLDEKTINKIAAGEVIEKPASIIKELVENSIDADSTEITVEIKSGGISYIRVIDNGKGISKEDMGTSFLRHATSKINTDLDLYNISTLGFRGEALASIAAVTKVEMMSRTKGEDVGYRIYIEGGTIVDFEECGCTEGTVVTVKDVFFNTPARLKFLKTESREAMYITNIMESLAMSHSNISFKYKLNDKMMFATKGDGDLKSVLLSIYGKEIVKNIIDVNCSKDFITVKGFIGNSNISKGNRNYQSTFVNGRYIKNKTIQAAVEAAYKAMLTINKFPFYVLHVYINPELVDVNVHPTKAEVKFQDEQIIFKAIYHCVKDALIAISPILEVEDKPINIFKDLPKVNYVQQEIKSEEIIKEDFKQSESDIREINDNSKQPIREYNAQNNRVDYNKRTDYAKFEDKQDEVINQNGAVSDRVAKFGPLAIVGQIHFMYIIAEGPEEMYMIDQHAAHERIYYERYMSEYKSFGIKSQSLIVPVVIDMSLSEKQSVFDNNDLLKKLGYEVEDFGGNAVALRYVPLIYGNPDPKELFYELIGDTELKNKDISAYTDKVIYTMACKSAIKAGDKLSYKEMMELIEQLRFCDNPYTCPHGRPTIVKMSYLELEKRFKRIQ
jgi:DNA mismatch repair protein MutL